MILPRIRRLSRAALALAAALLAIGCQDAAGPSTAASTYKDYLYMTDTVSGKLFAYDPGARVGLSSSIASTSQSATGEIAFYKGIGYVAVGYGAGQGLYYFDPSATNPTFKKISGSIAAQYLLFYGSGKAYASSYGTGLYTFNPSSPDSGLSQAPLSGTAGLALQEAVLAADGFLYVADNGNAKVLKINPSTDALSATISASAPGATGLAVGTYKGAAGVFVANNGGYSGASGSIDFIASSGAAATVVAAASSTGASIRPSRLTQLANGDLVATGYGHTVLVALSGASASAVELFAGGSAFGGLDLDYKDGLVYVPVAVTSDYVNYSNRLYVFDASGAQLSYGPVSVMTSSEGISNIGFYE